MTDIVYADSEVLSDAELNQLFGEAWPEHEPHHFQQILDRSLLWLTARNDGRLIGFVNVATDGGAHAFLLDPTVAPDFRRRGIGTELVRRAVDAAAARGAEWVHVDFVPELDAFYRKAGFRPTTAGLVRTAGTANRATSATSVARPNALHGAGTLPAPFDRLGAAGLLAGSVLGGVVATVLGVWPLHLNLDRDIAAFMALFYCGAGISVLARCRSAALSGQRLLGALPSRDMLRLAIVAVPLGALSMAGFWLLFLPVSYLAPAYVRDYLARSGAHPATDLISWSTMSLVAVVIAPVLEEVFFRGLLMQRWALKWGTLPGIVVSSALFALCHFEILGHFLFGVVMCALYLRTRRLWVSIATHALNNLLASVFTLGSVFQPQQKEDLTLGTFQAQWWVGLLLLIAGGVLLELYRRKYWRDVSFRALLAGPLPYFANE